MKRQNLYILITIVITSCLHSACAKGVAIETTAPSLSSDQIAVARSQADKLFAERTDVEKIRDAVKILEKVRDPNQRDFEVEWNFARFSYFLGLRSKDETEAGKALTSGKEAARIAANLRPDRPEGHFWYGANLGELCKRSPVTVGLRNVDEVRKEMNRVIEVDPGYQGASAFDVLAQIELATRIRGGSPEKAVEYLKKALEIEKENSNVYLHLAEAYFAMNKDAEAKQQIDHLLKMKPNPDYIPEHQDSVEAARKLLAEKSR